MDTVNINDVNTHICSLMDASFLDEIQCCIYDSLILKISLT